MSDPEMQQPQQEEQPQRFTEHIQQMLQQAFADALRKLMGPEQSVTMEDPAYPGAGQGGLPPQLGSDPNNDLARIQERLAMEKMLSMKRNLAGPEEE